MLEFERLCTRCLRSCAVMSALLMLSQTVAAQDTGRATVKRTAVYACDDKSTLTVEYIPPPENQANVTRRTSTWTLPQVRSGSGARYANRDVSVWNKGNDVLFEHGQLTLECTAVK